MKMAGQSSPSQSYPPSDSVRPVYCKVYDITFDQLCRYRVQLIIKTADADYKTNYFRLFRLNIERIRLKEVFLTRCAFLLTIPVCVGPWPSAWWSASKA